MKLEMGNNLVVEATKCNDSEGKTLGFMFVWGDDIKGIMMGILFINLFFGWVNDDN